MQDTMKKTAMGMAALGALALGGSALADAASTTTTKTTTTTKAAKKAAHRKLHRLSSTSQGNPNEKVLTGDLAAKVSAAALAKVPGTIERVSDDEGGGYEAHVRKADGTEVEVVLDSSFNVTATNTQPDHGGHGGPGGGNPNEPVVTGDTAAKVSAAALAKVPGTVERVSSEEGGGYEAHVRKADGTEVEVVLDSSFNVTATNTQPDHGGHGGPDGGHGGPDGDHHGPTNGEWNPSTNTTPSTATQQ